jgi:prepilin-type N-terminal cleavage/methylation domain-containing protein
MAAIRYAVPPLGHTASEHSEVAVTHRRSGFTLVEALVAVVVVGVGIVALVSASSSVTRMIGRGKMETRAAMAASGRLEVLRSAADATSPRCADPAFTSGGPIILGGVAEKWEVAPTGKVRPVRVTVTYLTVGGLRTASLETRITC